MKLLYYVDDDRSNFGDDLNRWLWKRLLGSALDVDDGTVLLGIGTILARGFVPPARKYIVLSSGVGYDAPPSDFGGPSWQVLAVRGPLTASVLELTPDKAATDGAALLRLLPACEPLPESERSGIVFMPHYESLAAGNWRQVSEMAGVEFLDPCADSEITVQRIRRARLVIADAMHAAIVADALRVPWIPVVLSPHSSTFKWLDWTMSLDLPYRPVTIPASTLLEALRNNSLRSFGNKLYVETHTAADAIEHLKRVIRLWSSNDWPRRRHTRSLVTYAIPRRIVSSPVFRGFKTSQDSFRIRRAAEALRKIAEMPSFLSDERVFQSKLDRLASFLPALSAEAQQQAELRASSHTGAPAEPQ